MKRILAAVLLIVATVALSTSALAIANIQYTFNQASVYSEAYNCLDANCAAVAAFSGTPPTQTTTTGVMTYSFPTVLAVPDGYALYYVSNGYVPMEYKANWYGTGSTSYPRIDFYQIANCQADVTLLDIYNAVLPNNSIVIQSAVGLNGATSSPFTLNNSAILPNYVPPSLYAHYSADVVVTLRIYNASGAQVNQQALSLTGANALFADELRPINFTWTPTVIGSYTAELTAHVTDNQCSSVVDTTDDETFTADFPLAPVISPVPDQVIQEDVGGSVDVNATDPNSDPITFSVTSENPAQVDCSFAANTLIMTPALNYVGAATCTIMASDGALDSAQVIVNITVTNTNDAPTLAAVPDQTVFEDLNNTVDIAPYANDIDGDALTYTVVGENPAQVDCSFTGSVLTMQATAYVGPATCSIRANDGFANSNTVIVNITVLFRNDPPVLGALPNQTILEDSTGNSLDIVQFATDEETDSMTAVVLADTPAEVDCDAVGTNVTMTPAANWFGNTTCTVAVTDGNVSNSQILNIEVLNVNDAPVLLALPDQSVDEDSSNTTNLTAYASDIDGDALTWHVAANGPSMTCFFTGSVLNFTPDVLFHGLTSCTVNVTDPSGASSVNQVVVIDVRHVNHAPIALNDSLLIDEDVTGSTNVLANDSDPDVGDVISISGWTDGAHGNVSCAGTDCFYTPNANYNGTDSFTYTITDGIAFATATVDVTVNPVNDAPVLLAIPDQSTNEDESNSTNIAPYASDVDGDTLIYNVVENGTNITCAFTGSVLTFTPDTYFHGLTSCTVNVTDPSGASSVNQVVAIDVRHVNHAPVALNDSLLTDEDTTGSTNVLANDSDVDVGDVLIISGWTDGAFGNVSCLGADCFYTPALNFNGLDSFTYTITDGIAFATATVDVTVTSVNDVPVLNPITNVSIFEDGNGTFDLSGFASDVDGDTLTWVVDTNGTDVDCVFSGSDITVTASTADYFGSDACVVSVTDGVDASGSQVFTIEVLSVNDAPSFTEGSDVPVIEDSGAYSAAWATAMSPGPLNEAGSLLFFIVGNNNTALFSAQPMIDAITGNLDFTPADNMSGSANVSVRLEDDDGTDNGGVNVSETVYFIITVTAVNDAPALLAIPDQSTLEDTTNSTDLALYASDVDGDVLTFNIVDENTTEVNCSFVGSVLSFTPALNWVGNATCTVNVTDPSAESSVNQVVLIEVRPINDAPIANDDSLVTLEDVTGIVDVLANDTDPDGDSISISGWTNGTSGTVACAGNNCAYTPAANWSGSDTFNYTITDGLLNDTATVFVTVTGVNDAPVLNPIANLTILEDGNGTFNLSGYGSDVDGDSLTWTVEVNGTDVDCVFSGSDLTVTAATADYFGPDACTVSVTDGIDTSASRVITIGVTPVNDAPDFTPGVDVPVDEDSGDYNAAWASGITAGPLNETAQALFFIVENNNTALFSGQPSIDATTGNLSFTPAANMSGSANVSVRLEDDGGVENGGVNVSGTANFMITVTPVNDDPVLTALPNVTLIEDQWGSLNISGNVSDVDGDALTYEIVSNGINVDCVFDGDNLTMTPAADFFGNESCSVRVLDGNGGNSETRIVTIEVLPVNDAPVLDAISDRTITEDTPTDVDLGIFVSDVDDTVHNFHVLANGPGMTCTFAGDIMTMTPALNFNGLTNCTINVTDPSGASSVNRIVNITVTPVNDAPIVVTQPGNVIIAQNSSITIDLSAYFSDVDSALTYGYGFSGTNMSFNQTGSFLTITPVGPSYFGNQSLVINFTASDGSLDATTNNVDIHVLENVIVGDNVVVNGTLFGASGVTRTDTTAYFQGTYGVYITGASWLYNSDIDDDANTNINGTHMWGTVVRNSWLINSLNITNSNITNSWLTNCVVINSTVKNIVASNCDFRDSLVDPPSGTNDLTGSTVGNHSTVFNSNVTYSIVDNSTITDSDIEDSVIRRSVLDRVIMDGATVTDSTGTGSTITNSTVQSGSTITNSTVQGGSTVTNSSVFGGSTVTNSTVSTSSVGNSTLGNSTITLSTIGNSTVTDSIVTNSTLQNDTIDDSSIINCVISNSTIDDSRLRNCNRPLTNVNLTNATIDDGQLCNGTLTFNGTSTTANNSCINITNLVNYAPVASFNMPSRSYVGRDTDFTDTSTDPNIPGSLNDFLTYSWDFDGLGTSSAENPSFSFSAVGNYDVTLTVTDRFGLQSTVTQTIEISRRSGGGGGGGSDDSYVSPGTYDIDVGGSSGGVCHRVVLNDVLRFDLVGKQQTVKVMQIGVDFITLNVSNTTRGVIRGVTSRIDLNGDATLDLALSLANVTYPYATLCLESVNISTVLPNATVTNTTIKVDKETKPKTGTSNVTTTTGAINQTLPSGNATGNETAAGTGGWSWSWPTWSLPAIPGSWIGWFIIVGIILFGLLIYGLIRFGLQRTY